MNKNFRIAAARGRDKTNPSIRGKSNENYIQMLELGGGISNTITSVAKDNYVFSIEEISIPLATSRNAL